MTVKYMVSEYSTAFCGNMKKQEKEMKWKLETETGNWKQKWKRNFFAAVVLARFNPSALPASMQILLC